MLKGYAVFATIRRAETKSQDSVLMKDYMQETFVRNAMLPNTEIKMALKLR